MAKVLCGIVIAVLLIAACERERAEKPNPFQHHQVAIIQ